HDFNNLLTVITSYSDLLLQDLGGEDPKREDVEQVRKAAEGAAALTRQLLAFSRQQVLAPRVVSLSVVVQGVEKMLRRGIGAAVSDTGIGMDEATKARIFEPFFTTKEPGKGTGLGLATVYGIVQQSGGFIWVYSEPGHGTTFKIYLPQVEAPLEGRAVGAAPGDLPRGTETILLVEDAAAVRAVTRQVLERQGYTVLEAAHGAAALQTAAGHPGPIHLLLTDVVMPVLSGRQLADQLARLRPDAKVLYASGYTDDAVVRHGVLESGISYLQKPFTADSLARKVREVLDRPTRSCPRQAGVVLPIPPESPT